MPTQTKRKTCAVKGCKRKAVSLNGTALNGKRCKACNHRERYRTDPVFREQEKARGRANGAKKAAAL